MTTLKSHPAPSLFDAAALEIAPGYPSPRLSLAVLVPVYNEQYLVQASLERLGVLGKSPLLDRVKVIVVDDCSRDNTPEVLRRFQALLADGSDPKFEWVFVRHEHNQGKGGAIRTALEYADTDLTCIHDADLEYHPRDLLSMVPLFLSERADAVFGSRFLAGGFKRALFFRHSMGNRLLTFFCNLASDLDLTDMETCYKMVRTDVLRSIPIESHDFRIEPEFTIKLAKRNARIFEVPISYSGRTYQDGKKITWKDGLKALKAILKFAASDNIYKKDEYGSEILTRLRRAPHFTRWMADTIRGHIGDRVLEIGAGIGNFTLNLVPRTLYWATDINPMYLHELRKLEETRPYLHAATLNLAAGESFPSDQKFDTVVCLNILEHVRDDRAALRNIREVLEENGRAIVLVPQGPSLFGTLDEVLGHQRRYRRDQLTKLAEEAGFRVREVLEFNRSSVPAWWWNGKIMRRRSFGQIQIKMLNLLVPLFRRLDRWLPLPPLSLIAVLERN